MSATFDNGEIVMMPRPKRNDPAILNEKPILFNDEMVLAILKNRKTQTRRIDKNGKPLCTVGDKLWVREAHAIVKSGFPADDEAYSIVYRATSPNDKRVTKWRPSIHMLRADSRINLEVAGVRHERLQDISERDAIEEGIDRQSVTLGSYHKVFRNYGDCENGNWFGNPIDSYESLWKSINGDESWDKNPMVFVCEFKVEI